MSEEQEKGRQIGQSHLALPSSAFKDGFYVCPKCKSTDLLVVGYFKRIFAQEYKENKPVEDSMGMGGEALQVVEAVDCHSCNTHIMIEDDEAYAREELIFDLELQIAVLQGKVPVNPMGQTRVN